MTKLRVLQVVSIGVGALCACSESARSAAEPMSTRSDAVEIAPGVELSDEFVVDLPTYVTASTLVSAPPSFDGENYLIAYQYDQVYVARVSRDGQVLDPRGIVLGDRQDAPAVAFDGTNWIAAWLASPDPSSFRRELRCARIQPDGKVLDPVSVIVNSDTKAAGTPHLFFDGSKLLFQAGFDWQLLDTECSPIGAEFRALGGFEPAALVFDGAGYVALYQQCTLIDQQHNTCGLWVTHLSSAGANEGEAVLVDTITTNPFLTSGFETAGALASRFGTTIVAYNYGTGGDPTEIRLRNVPPSGAVGPALTLAIPPSTDREPSAVATDAGFVVASSGGDGRLDRVDFDGVEHVSAALPADALDWSLGATDGQRLLGAGNYLALFDESLALVGPRVPLLEVTEHETSPLAATNRDEALIVFDSDLSGFVAERISKAGERLDPAPLVLGRAPWNLGAVASNGTDFLVAWDTMSPYRPLVRRVLADGELEAPVEIGGDVDATVLQYWPKLASNGSDYLLTWWRSANLAVDDALVATRVSASGVALDDPPLTYLHRYPGRASGVASAFDGSSYLVAEGDEGGPIQLGRVSPSTGAVSWSATPWTGFVRDFVWGDDQGLVVFQTSFNFFAARLDAAGNALDDPAITLSDTCCQLGNDDVASASWDGSVFWTARIDKLIDGMPLALARVSPSGELLDPAGIHLLPNDGQGPLVSSFGLTGWDHTSLLFYSRLDSDPTFRSMRVRGRFLGAAAPTAGAGGTAGSGAGTSNGGAPSGGNGAASGGSPSEGGAGAAGSGGAADGGTGDANSGGSPEEGGHAATPSSGGHGATTYGGQAGEPNGGHAAGHGNAGAHAGTSSAGAGAAGTAGKSGGGGKPSGTGGATGGVSEGGAAGSPSGDDGCGCRVPRRESHSVWGLVALVALILGRRPRRPRLDPAIGRGSRGTYSDTSGIADDRASRRG